MRLLGWLEEGTVLREIVRIGAVIAGAAGGLGVVVAEAVDAGVVPVVVDVADMVGPDTRKAGHGFHGFFKEKGR